MFLADNNVPSVTIDRLIERLDEAKQDFTERGRLACARILGELARRNVNSAESLVRFHEALLFLRAYPQNKGLLKLAESELAAFAKRVQRLSDIDADLTLLEHPEVSGIAGASLADAFGYFIARWLVRTQPGRVALDEDWVDDTNRLAETWPRFMPLLDEDAMVEANVPYRQWLRAGKPRGRSELQWLFARFESLPLSEREKAELYDSLQLYLRWRPGYRATRTGMRLPARPIFYHNQPLIRRKDVSLAAELKRPTLRLQMLSPSEGQKILNLTRETSTIRYRELYGFTHGDPARVLKADVGRGVVLFIVGLPPEKRLPIRAYHAAMIFKNGVAVGYFEGLSIFERMESGFNLYYTFREGETAWIYARVLSVFRQLLGVTAWSIDPYQVGHENAEGIESGAYWFYRKLGFRPTQRQLLELTMREEEKIASRAGYRTPARTLRKLAAGYMIYEPGGANSGAWDDFQIRRIGMAAQRRMAGDFNGDPHQFREHALRQVSQALGLQEQLLKPLELRALRELALVLALIPRLDDWSKAEKELLVKIIRAKASADEAKYLRLLQRHPRLRREIIRIGSSGK